MWSWRLSLQYISIYILLWLYLTIHHPRRPRGSQSGREKRRDESFQARAEEPLGTDSHRTISKRSSECWLLIGHRKCFVLLCPIGEQFLQSHFLEFVHDGYYLATVARFVRGILNSLIFTKTWSVQAWIPVVSSSLYFRKSVFSFRIDSILKWRVYIKLKVCWLRAFLWCMSQTSRDRVNSRMYELTKRTQEMLFADWVQ